MFIKNSSSYLNTYNNFSNDSDMNNVVSMKGFHKCEFSLVKDENYTYNKNKAL